MSLTFEFPTSDAAADFLEAIDGEGSRSHRVVDVEHVDNEATARALAAQLGGEGKA